MKRRSLPADFRTISVLILISAGVSPVLASTGMKAADEAVFARVNGSPVSAELVKEKIEELYPTSSVHARPGGSPELRQKAMDAVILDELIWQQAVKDGKVIPFAAVQQQVLRSRHVYGAQAFDANLLQSGMSRRQYAEKLQRTLTIQQARKEHVEGPAHISPEEVRAYFDNNPKRFFRPERVRFRLILVAVESNASKEVEDQRRKKAGDLYAQLKAGKDFGDVAYAQSDDVYSVMGGDVGWMHKGSMDPEFEPIALSLPIGQFTAPFRTPLGYSILKVEAREPAREISFEEIRDKLGAQLTALKAKQLEQAWEGEMKKDATIEILDKNAGFDAPPPETVTLTPSH
jgi:peptidyl-prolyl cis-trans isomerase C